MAISQEIPATLRLKMLNEALLTDKMKEQLMSR